MRQLANIGVGIRSNLHLSTLKPIGAELGTPGAVSPDSDRKGPRENIHLRGLIHKDIRPENMLVALEPTGHAGLHVSGTDGHMNRSIDIRKRLYSLGVTLIVQFRRLQAGEPA